MNHVTLWAAFFTHASGRASTRWYGNVDYWTAVPQGIRARFLANHAGIAP